MKIRGKCTIFGSLGIRPLGGAKNIEIGNGTFINAEIRFGVPIDNVIIGKNVQIGSCVMFETVNHGLEHLPGNRRAESTKPIIIEDEVWIGGGSIILQSVTISRGSVVAAGALVTKNGNANIVVAGVPARQIRKINDDAQ
ncbi:MAG: DapH/DapD/GlmU-related protein [Cyanobacteria bacterium P01_A01_bin.123]